MAKLVLRFRTALLFPTDFFRLLLIHLLARMSNCIIAYGFTLILLVLMVNANENSELKKGPYSTTEDLEHYVESLIKSESEKPAEPELSILEKPMLLEQNAAKSKTDESSMKHMKLLAEWENVMEHESARPKVASVNDNTHNAVVSASSIPILQNASSLPITHKEFKKLTAKENSENTLLSPPAHAESPKNHLKLPEMTEEDSTSNDNGIEEFTIGPFNLRLVTDIVNSMLFGSIESETNEAFTEHLPEYVVTPLVVIQGLVIDKIDSVTEQSEPETSTTWFTETTVENPLLEVVELLANLELEATTLLTSNIVFLPFDRFDFFVFDENSNLPCILMAMNVTLSISYETRDQKYTTTDYKLPNEIVTTGRCGNENSSMTLSWANDSPIIRQNSITLNFAKDNSSFYVDCVQFNITLDPHHFPNAKGAYITGNSSKNLKLFSAPVKNGMHVCPTETKITCGNSVATISNVTVIAFNKNQELSGRKEEYCSIISEIDQEVSVSSIIGGIVGAVIALAVVLILFSWCRRRSDISLRSELP